MHSITRTEVNVAAERLSLIERGVSFVLALPHSHTRSSLVADEKLAACLGRLLLLPDGVFTILPIPGANPISLHPLAPAWIPHNPGPQIEHRYHGQPGPNPNCLAVCMRSFGNRFNPNQSPPTLIPLLYLPRLPPETTTVHSHGDWCGGPQVIDDCDNQWNQILTVLGFLHICFQPFMTHVLNSALSKNPKVLTM